MPLHCICYVCSVSRYLNTHVVKRYKYCDVKVDFSQYGIDHDGKMMEIGQVFASDLISILNYIQHTDSVTRN